MTPRVHVSTARPPADCLRRQGFSLLELILVMTILVITAAAVTPMLGSFALGRAHRDAAAHVLALMQYAADQAAVNGWAYRMNFDEQAGTYWLSSAPYGVNKRIESEIGRTFELPDNITMTLEGSEEVLANRYIQFEPDGRHHMAVVRLTPSRGNELVIGSASPAEPFAIGSASQVREEGQ